MKRRINMEHKIDMKPGLASLALMLFCLGLTQQSAAREFHSLDDIAATARAYVIAQLSDDNESIEVTSGQIDKRLRLSPCSKPLQAFSPGYEARRGLSTVGVRCEDDQPWSLYVPVTVKIYKEVAVLKKSVARNEPLSMEHIEFEKTNVNRLSSGYFTHMEELKGKILTQNLPSGTILTQHLVKSPMAVKRGQLVTLIARNDVIEVRAEGKALSRGAVGERIRVKNLKTDRIIEGVIVNNHLINVNL